MSMHKQNPYGMVGQNNMIKQNNFRINQDTADKFREFCEKNGMNQAQGFDHVMQIVEMDKAKSAAPGRATEIERFEKAMKDITSLYLTGIEISNDAEARAREQFSSALERQDRTIDELQKRIAALQDELEKGRAEATELKKEKEMADKEKIAAERLKDSAEKTAADKQTIADTLASKLAEAETKAREYDGLMRELNQLKELNREPEQKLKEINRDHAEELKDAERKAEREKEAALAVKQMEIEDLKTKLHMSQNETELVKKDAENAKMIAYAEVSEEYRAEIANLHLRIQELTDKLMENIGKR